MIVHNSDVVLRGQVSLVCGLVKYPKHFFELLHIAVVDGCAPGQQDLSLHPGRNEFVVQVVGHVLPVEL